MEGNYSVAPDGYVDLEYENIFTTGQVTAGDDAGNGTTKGKRNRQIPIHPELRKTLDNLSRDFENVFTARPSNKHPAGGGLISERRLLVSLKRLCKRCKFTNPDQYNLHTFRHAFASMLARTNVGYNYALESNARHSGL